MFLDKTSFYVLLFKFYILNLHRLNLKNENENYKQKLRDVNKESHNERDQLYKNSNVFSMQKYFYLKIYLFFIYV